MRTLLLHIMAACLLFGQAREIGRAVEVVTQPVVRLGRGAITDIDWSPDDRWFVTTGQAGTVQLWDHWYGPKVRDFVSAARQNSADGAWSVYE
jgi:WD40 repeat protein